jgi:uncharacterized membrane protein
MKNPLENLHQTLGIGLVVAIVVLIVGNLGKPSFDQAFWAGLFRWLHVFTGVLWIGLLYYFNFVQMPTMPKIPAEQRPAVSKFIAPEALFWFRWAAAATVVFGLITAMLSGYLSALWTFGLNGSGARHTMIGIGMWMAIIMAINVWFVIWPNQQKALGLVEVDADTRTKAARTAMLFSRFNTMFSIGMFYAMVMAKNAG